MKFGSKHPEMEQKFQFAVRALKSRWFVLVAAIWIQCCSGASYDFGIYSQTIKLALKYDQTDLDTLAAFKDVGSNVGVVSGLVFDQFPPWVVLAIGALQCGLGYLGMWLCVTGKVSPPAFWQMCVCMFLGANGQTFFNTATVVTCVQNFPRSRGIIIGLMKGFLGLSGAILTQVYRAIYADEPTSFLFMLMWLPTAMACMWMFIIRPVPAPERSNENDNLYLISAIAVALAAYLMGIIVVENTLKPSHVVSVIVCVTVVIVLLLPLGVVVKSECEDGKLEESAQSSSLTEHLLDNASERLPISVTVNSPEPRSVAEKSGTSHQKVVHSESGVHETILESASDNPPERTRPRRGEDHSVMEALWKADFWLLFVSMACGMGSGLTAVDNMGQIGAAQGYSPQKVGTFISLLSIWNFLGRLGFGTISEVCLHRYKIARPVFLALTQATMSLGHLMFAAAFSGSLYIGSVVIGLCYGAQWSLMPAITSELFGLLRFGTLYNTIAIASPLGAYYLSVRVAGHIYDYEAQKERSAAPRDNPLGLGIFRLFKSSELSCHGPHCFRLTFVIMAAVSFLGSLVCLILVARTRRFYARFVLHLKTMRIEKEAEEQGQVARV